MKRYFPKQQCVTLNQAKLLDEWNYYGGVVYTRCNSKEVRIATIDDAIDWLRRKFNVIIYNSVEPFVDPRSNKIVYRMSVKYCNVRDGWNGRIYIGESKITSNIYAAKRESISIALRWIKKKEDEKKKNQNTRIR